jgi:hypothetical protein
MVRVSRIVNGALAQLVEAVEAIHKESVSAGSLLGQWLEERFADCVTNLFFPAPDRTGTELCVSLRVYMVRP